MEKVVLKKDRETVRLDQSWSPGNMIDKGGRHYEKEVQKGTEKSEDQKSLEGKRTTGVSRP